MKLGKMDKVIEARQLDFKIANALITSASAKIPLIDAFKKAINKINPKNKVIAADTSPLALSRYVADQFWEMPVTDTLSVDKILKFCLDNEVKCILPTRDGELAFWANQKELFKLNGINVVISCLETIDFCLDKLKFFQRCSEKGFSAIPTTTVINDLNCDIFVVKERLGAGSELLSINLDKNDAQAHAAVLSSPIFQPYIEGMEISIDAWIDTSHKVKGLVLRRREIVVLGESKVTTTFRNEIIEKQCIDLLESFEFYGPIVLQAIIDKKNKIHFIECNSRFGGASTASIAVGLDSLYWSFLDSCGVDISTHIFMRSSNDTTQIRVQRDIHTNAN